VVRAGSCAGASPAVDRLSSYQTPELAPGGLVPFRAGLRETGFVEGRDVAIEYRFASFNSARLPALAADLVSRQVSVIVTGGGDQTALAAKVTTTIPIVFVGAGNPIEIGLVASFNRPGGNITGVSLDVNELMAKRVELLHQLTPGARTIVLLVRPSAQGGSGSAETNETDRFAPTPTAHPPPCVSPMWCCRSQPRLPVVRSPARCNRP
jgi:putative tryptophan/tyrosine transport system substrate-binding protein